MSSDNIETHENAEQGPQLPEISQAKRKRLQQLFEHGTLQSNQSNYDYATELLMQCVLGEPGNTQYVQLYLNNLKKKYNNNRKGHAMSFLKLMGPHSAVKKAIQKEDWLAVIENGIKGLQWNPWDTAILFGVTRATQTLGFVDVPLLFLKLALEGNPKDVEVNRTCGKYLEDLGRIEDSYQCWRRVSEMKSGDDEAERNMSRLTVARTLNQTGYTKQSVSATSKVTTRTQSGATVELTHEQFLEQQIRQQPKDQAKYLELAEIYTQTENFDKAVEILRRAVDACGKVPELLDRLEDVETRAMRKKLGLIAKKSGKDSEEWKAARAQLLDKELEIWRDRCERYPNNLGFKYDLGLRYQMKSNHDEAIKQFQIAKKEPRRSGLCCLALGQSFQAIRQYRLAMANYEEAIEKIPDRDADNKKRAYYLAGKLAMALEEWATADKFLTPLADMDFSYRDVSEILAKVSEKRKAGEN